MHKKIFVGCLISAFAFTVLPLAFAQSWSEEAAKEENLIVAKGEITEIAEDGSYITVDDEGEKTRFLTTKEFISEEYLEVGDKVKVYGEKTASGIKLTNYEYDYDDYSGEEYDSSEE